MEQSADTKNKAFAKAFSAASENVTRQIEANEKSLTSEEKQRLKDPAVFEIEICNVIPDARRLKFFEQFFVESFMNLSEKTRSIIDFSFSGFIYSLLREPVYSLFCRHA